MAPRFLIPIALVALTATSLPAADPENPFKKAEKGQWVSYRLNMVVNKTEQSGQVKHQIVSVSDKSVKIQTSTTLNGTSVPLKSRPST